MRLGWVGAAELTEHDRRMHPNGYWYAKTDDGGFDGAGPDPLIAVSNLAGQMERHLAMDRSTRDGAL